MNAKIRKHRKENRVETLVDNSLYEGSQVRPSHQYQRPVTISAKELVNGVPVISNANRFIVDRQARKAYELNLPEGVPKSFFNRKIQMRAAVVDDTNEYLRKIEHSNYLATGNYQTLEENIKQYASAMMKGIKLELELDKMTNAPVDE